MSEARHIQSMIDFIEREALEKVEELEAAAQEEYDVEKMRVVEIEKGKIRQQAEKKKTQVEIDCRVSKANYSKTQRMRIMTERAKVMAQLSEMTKKKVMETVSNSSVYSSILEKLIRESLLAIQSSGVVQCIKEEEPLVSGLLKNVSDWYRNQTKESITVTISPKYLIRDEAWGGVVVSSTDGRIVCNNTLSHRSKTAFEEQLPTVRYYLFNPEGKL